MASRKQRNVSSSVKMAYVAWRWHTSIISEENKRKYQRNKGESGVWRKEITQNVKIIEWRKKKNGATKISVAAIERRRKAAMA